MEQVVVHVDPSQERDPITLPTTSVFVLHPSIVDDRLASALYSWTSSPLQYLYDGVSDVIYEKIIEACQIHGVDINVVRKVIHALGKYGSPPSAASSSTSASLSRTLAASTGAGSKQKQTLKATSSEEEELELLKRQMQISLKDFGKVSCAHKLLTSFLRQVQSSPVVRYCVNEGVKVYHTLLQDCIRKKERRGSKIFFAHSLELILASHFFPPLINGL